MKIFEIPLSPTPQAFQADLAGVTYQITVKWNPQIPSWVLDIATSQSVPIISGIPLVTGADLLAQYAYLGIEGQLHVQTDTDTDVVPTVDNLGKNSHLYFVTS